MSDNLGSGQKVAIEITRVDTIEPGRIRERKQWVQ